MDLVIKLVDQTLKYENIDSIVLDLWIVSILCVTAIAILLIISYTIIQVCCNKEKKTTKAVLKDLLKNDKDIVKLIREK